MQEVIVHALRIAERATGATVEASDFAYGKLDSVSLITGAWPGAIAGLPGAKPRRDCPASH